jgi:hypothetical protein
VPSSEFVRARFSARSRVTSPSSIPTYFVCINLCNQFGMETCSSPFRKGEACMIGSRAHHWAILLVRTKSLRSERRT